MERWKGKVAVVTGASSGIGAAISKLLVETGIKVAGIARRINNVQELARQLEHCPGKLYAVHADLTKENDILEAFKWVIDNVGPVHILINNAGIIRQTNLVEGDAVLWKEILDTNVIGLCIATREAIRQMRENNIDGHIVHINSTAGHGVPNIPNTNVYPASKYAVTALTETLRQELNLMGSKIKISGISPGVVDTDIFLTSLELSGKKISDLPPFPEAEYPKLNPTDIADAVFYILSTPPHVQVHELLIKPLGEPF